MEKTTILIAFLVLFAGKGTQAQSVICHSCTHLVYTSSDRTLESFLYGISEYESNCLSEGNNYQEVYQSSCYGECFKETGTAVLRFRTSIINLEVAQRGCSSDSVRAGTCKRLTVEKLVSEYGFTVESEDLYGCYCDSDHCNLGNSLRPGFEAGFRMMTVVAITIMLG